MAHERRIFEYGREPWFVDAQDQTMRVNDDGFDAAVLTEKGILVGVTVWEGDDQDRPGQRQVGLSELLSIPFSEGPDPSLDEEDVAQAVQAKGQEISQAARRARPGGGRSNGGTS